MLPTEAEGRSCTRQRANGKFGSGELMEIQEVRVRSGRSRASGVGEGRRPTRSRGGDLEGQVVPVRGHGPCASDANGPSNRLQPPSPTRYGVLDSVLRTSTSSVP